MEQLQRLAEAVADAYIRERLREHGNTQFSHDGKTGEVRRDLLASGLVDKREMPASTKKQVNRYFNGTPTSRLIVTVENELVDKVDSMIKRRGGDYSHPCYGNRAEFVRQAIAGKLARDSA